MDAELPHGFSLTVIFNVKLNAYPPGFPYALPDNKQTLKSDDFRVVFFTPFVVGNILVLLPKKFWSTDFCFALATRRHNQFRGLPCQVV